MRTFPSTVIKLKININCSYLKHTIVRLINKLLICVKDIFSFVIVIIRYAYDVSIIFLLCRYKINMNTNQNLTFQNCEVTLKIFDVGMHYYISISYSNRTLLLLSFLSIFFLFCFDYSSRKEIKNVFHMNLNLKPS
jgi:hypothetical protein